LITNPSEERIDDPCGRIPERNTVALSELPHARREEAMHQANNEHANNPLEDQWALVLDPYEDHPVKALILAQNFQPSKTFSKRDHRELYRLFTQWTRR
jgi:hypothetical protein